MVKRVRRKSARPIGNRRDFEGASALVKQLSDENERDSAAELRLKSLLRELDKYDDAEEDEADSGADDYDASAPRRRWSDEGE